MTITINIKKVLAKEICNPSNCKERNPDLEWCRYGDAPSYGCNACVLEFYKLDNEHSETDFDEWLDRADHLNLRIVR